MLDADGLNAHAGELESLAGASRADRAHPARRRARAPARDRVSDEVGAHRLAARPRGGAGGSRCVVVLKGDDTIVADGASEDSRSTRLVAAPALATAGTGDVLAGTIGALLARGLGPFEAACAAVSRARAAPAVAGRADRRGAESVIASDVDRGASRPAWCAE